MYPNLKEHFKYVFSFDQSTVTQFVTGLLYRGKNTYMGITSFINVVKLVFYIALGGDATKSPLRCMLVS